jgi:hypothetical protein
MAHFRLRPMGFSEILDGGFSLYRNHFRAMFLTALIPFFPMALLFGLFSAEMAMVEETGDLTAILLVFPLMFLYGVAFLIVWGAITHQAARAVTGGEVTVKDGFAQGLRRALPLLGSGVVSYMLMMLGIMVVAGVIGGAAALLATAVGTITAVVVAVVVGLAMTVAVFAGLAGLFAIAPAVVIEKKGPLRSIGRSWALSRGARLRVLGIMSVVWMITMLPTFGVMTISGFGAAFAAEGTVTGTILFVVGQLITALGGAFTTPFWVICTTLLYYDRRVRLEAYDLELDASQYAATA